jgi:hypothetical protein
MSLWKKWFPAPTPAEHPVQNLQSLGQEAEKRGITVWLKNKYGGTGGKYLKTNYLLYDEAYKTNRTDY